MPDRNSDPNSGSHSTAKRSLPSWMSSTEDRKKSQKKQNETSNKILLNNEKEENITSACDAIQNNCDFSKLLEGVVFVLSGFVNPERGTLRAQAVEMGAEYQADWNSGCTLLICAFPNTPKFRQVETDCGTIVSKGWILECYKHKTLVEIERYLMYAGKPWRRYIEQNQPNKVQGSAISEELIKRCGKRSLVLTGSASSEGGFSSPTKNVFLPSQIKDWAADDLRKTMSWLQCQDEKPQAMEITSIAAKGIITCLQDVLDSLKKNKDIKTVTDKWMFVPHVVTYLAELEGGNHSGLLSKKELYELADSCKRIYDSELEHLNSSSKGEKYITEGYQAHPGEPNEEEYDSDRTIEMTEDEIDFACKQIGC
ncbi:hypothetical protein KSP39_PZI024475 [Platanthera zijinensis]|uniref:BRCT domain-containing protein n=1 Tax=Platanthera zijinensis TaxID=2320716 RepID=A0AAP0FSR4_9ASPA